METATPQPTERDLGSCPTCRTIVALDACVVVDAGGPAVVYRCAFCQTHINEHRYFMRVPALIADLLFAP